MRAVALILIAIWAGAAQAQSSFPQIDQERSALAQAAETLKKASGGKSRLAALGFAVSAHEIALAAFRDGLRNMATRESRMRTAIEDDRARLEDLLGALQSLSRAPRSALLAFPGGPVGAARGAALMSDISPALQDRINALKDRLEALRQLRNAQEVARIEARGTLATLQELRGTTAEALRKNRRRDLAPRSELKAQAQAAAKRIKTLNDLADALKGVETADTGQLVSFTEARGLIRPPVLGKTVAGFGEPDPWGRPGFGLTLEAPAYAQVSAPWDGTVRYAGPLIDYGQVLVLEPEKDTLLVLAGLGRVDRLVGETVLAGERLGDLGGPIPASDEFLLEASTDRDEIKAEKIYIELRRNGKAVDPATWFDLTKRGSGG